MYMKIDIIETAVHTKNKFLQVNHSLLAPPHFSSLSIFPVLTGYSMRLAFPIDEEHPLSSSVAM